jgi:hypothetical protein
VALDGILAARQVGWREEKFRYAQNRERVAGLHEKVDQLGHAIGRRHVERNVDLARAIHVPA